MLEHQKKGMIPEAYVKDRLGKKHKCIYCGKDAIYIGWQWQFHISWLMLTLWWKREYSLFDKDCWHDFLWGFIPERQWLGECEACIILPDESKPIPFQWRLA